MRSKGEQKIAELLNKSNIVFETEKRFIDCKGYRGKPLRFDFYIPSKKCCIEYHGEQHYFYTRYFTKTKKEWLYRREMDLIKAQYCLEHHIALYVIPFSDYDLIKNIEDIFQDKYKIKNKWYLYEQASKNKILYLL